MFKTYGEERWARRIARRIVTVRQRERIETSGQLARIVRAAIPRKKGFTSRIHPATRVFMALRIAVNRELEHLETFLQNVPGLLRPKGRLCVLSFHSLEDRMVKRFLRDHSRVDPALARLPVVPADARPRLRLPVGAIRAGAAELQHNPRARSATLRVGERL